MSEGESEFPMLPVVHLEGGRIPDAPAGLPPAVPGALAALSRGSGEVYVIDVLGLHRNKADLETIQAGSKGAILWLDAGSRFATDAMDVLVAGATRVTLRWNTLHSDKELAEACEVCEPGTAYLGLEFPEGRFLPNSRERGTGPRDLARRATELGLGLVIAAPRYDRSIAESFADFTGEKWWLGPAGAKDVADLRGVGYKGALVPVALLPREGEAPVE